MAFDLTHARHDPTHCLAPGLFRSLKRGERKRLKLDVTYHYAENEQARFVGFEPLGADDMRLTPASLGRLKSTPCAAMCGQMWPQTPTP